MEEANNRKISVEELINITVVILSSLGINEVREEETDLSLDNAVKTLHEYKVMDINGDEDPNHFAYFIKKLFLDDDGKVDLDLNELSQNIPRKFIIEIFQSLINQLKAKQFFNFIFSLGEIFTSMYFSNQINEDILNEFEKKGINDYEIILKLFSRCKHNKSCEFFFMNYDIYFSRSYFYEVKARFLSSLELYFELSLSLPNSNEELKYEEECNSHNTTIDSENRIEKSKAEDSIFRNLKLFWCNSCFVYESIILDNFMNFIYNFMTKKKSNIVIDNNLDSFSKKYMNYILYPLQKLFNNYDENTFKEFKDYLNNFVIFNKNEQIDFIQKPLRILGPNDENVGLLSLYCFDKATNESVEKIANSLQDISEDSIRIICDNNGLDEYEELILRDNINKKKENLKLNKIELLPEINLEIHDNNSENKSKQKEVLYQNEMDQLSKDKKVIIDKKNLQDDDFILNLKKVIEVNQLLQEQVNDLKIKAENNKLFEEQITEKNKLLVEQINDQVEKTKFLEEQMKVQIEKCKLLEEHLNSLNIKVDKLENLHRGIYFRDISKFYIDTFCQNNNIKGDDTYHRAENLLKMDYKNNLKDYKQTMCEIAQHYKEGYNIAHMEYFIKKFNNKSKNEIAEEILYSYVNFMDFGQKQKQLLKNNFNLLRASFLYYK